VKGLERKEKKMDDVEAKELKKQERERAERSPSINRLLP
jgi:hypothetical protein